MTAPTVDLDPSVRQHLDEVWEEFEADRRRRERIRRRAPLARVWDGDYREGRRLTGEIEAAFEWKLNDTGEGRITLPADHHIARWVSQYWKRDVDNVNITVDKDGARWSGMLDEVVTEQDDEGVREVTLIFLHDYEHIKHVLVWSNPFTPAAIQFPRAFILAGPSKYMLKLALMLNLARLQGNWWAMPDDPLDPESWTRAADMSQWQIAVKPGALRDDGSPWTLLSSRFKYWHDMAESTLGDGHLMVECRRWLTGDPEPWPGYTPRNGQLIVDIVDKSNWWGQTSTGGSVGGGLLRTIVSVADDLMEEGRSNPSTVGVEPRYLVSGALGTAPAAPWVTFRTDTARGLSQVESTRFSWQPATAVQMVGGGHSMPGVNEGISSMIQLAGSLASAFFFIPNFGGVADTLLRPLYEDTLLAFMSYKSLPRSSSLGWTHYLEHWAQGADKAYTLSGLLAMRKALWETRERTSHTVQIADGGPYLVGEDGHGHFFLGDRVGAEIPGTPDGEVAVEQVSALRLAWDAATPHEWEVTVGDGDADRDPVEWGIDKIKQAFAALQDLGVM